MLKIDPKLQKHFKNFCYSPQIIMLCLYMKFRFSLSYRDIEELCQLRGLTIDHSTFQRWVERFASLLDGQFRKRKHSVDCQHFSGQIVTHIFDQFHSQLVINNH